MTPITRTYSQRLQITYLICLFVSTGCQSVPPDIPASTKCVVSDLRGGFETKAGVSNSVILATPYYINGKHLGYVLHPGSDPAIFETVGLFPSDLLLEVDGCPLANQKALIGFTDRLSRGDSVIAKVDRNGEITDVELRMK